MHITKHGSDHIRDRTRLEPWEVARLIKKEVFVSLGVLANSEYLLFYSPADHKCKIAVVTEDRSSLMSVWEIGFELPLGIRNPGHSLGEAKEKYFKYQTTRSQGLRVT
jgi:hypothetical protein